MEKEHQIFGISNRGTTIAVDDKVNIKKEAAN
jgi:hypothetical protein